MIMKKNGVMMNMMILELIGWIFLLAMLVTNYIFMKRSEKNDKRASYDISTNDSRCL